VGLLAKENAELYIWLLNNIRDAVGHLQTLLCAFLYECACEFITMKLSVNCSVNPCASGPMNSAVKAHL
jgi:hypothetical protein